MTSTYKQVKEKARDPYMWGQITAVAILIGSFFIRWWLPLAILGALIIGGLLFMRYLERQATQQINKSLGGFDDD